MKKIYLTLLLTGFGSVIMAQKSSRAKSHENIVKATKTKHETSKSKVEGEQLNNSRNIDKLSISDECKKELTQLIANDPEKMELAVLKIQNAQLKNQQVLTTVEFATYQLIIDKANANPVGDKEIEQREAARTTQRKYVSISELLK